MLAGRRQLGSFRCAAARLDQQPVQMHAEDDAEAAKNDERQPPAVVLTDQPGEESAADGSDVDARLVESHRPRTRVAGRDSR